MKTPTNVIDAPDRDRSESTNGFARRDLMKIGAAAVAGLPIIAGSPLFAQQPPSSSATSVQPQPSNPAVAASESGGWDEPSRQLVDYAASFSEANLSDRVAEAVRTAIDGMIADLLVQRRSILFG